MGHLHQNGVLLERPPFYRMPRARPVTFERPEHSSTEDLCAKLAQCQKSSVKLDGEETMARDQYDQYHGLPTFNALPRPFARDVSSRPAPQYAQHCDYAPPINELLQQQQQANQQNPMPPPKILINDKSPYPTSTVHKSMLSCRRSQFANQDTAASQQHAATISSEPYVGQYSRLISPTTVSASAVESPQSSIAHTATSTMDGLSSISGSLSTLRPSQVGREVHIPVTLVDSTRNKPRQQQPPAPQEQQLYLSTSQRLQQQQLAASSASSPTSKTLSDSGAGSPNTSLSTSAYMQTTSAVQPVDHAKLAYAPPPPLPSTGDVDLAAQLALPKSRAMLMDKQTSECAQVGTGAVSMQTNDSNVVMPDTKRDEYMWNKHLERASIAYQTYRTLPIVSPKPKARHDLASGTYMRFGHDPSWELAHARPSSADKNFARKIQQAICGGGGGGDGVSQVSRALT